MKKRLNLHFKTNTLEELKQLAEESDIRDSKVYLCRRLIRLYANKVKPDEQFAKNPIKNHLLARNYCLTTKIFTIWLTDEEFEGLQKLIAYNNYIEPQTGKPQYSFFLACLIRHQWEKKFGQEQKGLTNPKPKKPTFNPDLLDPSKFASHSGEDWAGDSDRD